LARGTLVIGTDGLFNHASADRIMEAANVQEDPGALPGALIDLVRLQGGALQDDVAVVAERRG
jgi:hypothetical protein